jgi:hypothetical protein
MDSQVGTSQGRYILTKLWLRHKIADKKGAQRQLALAHFSLYEINTGLVAIQSNFPDTPDHHQLFETSKAAEILSASEDRFTHAHANTDRHPGDSRSIGMVDMDLLCLDTRRVTVCYAIGLL